MEKNGVVVIVASKAAGEEALFPVQVPVEASKETAIPVQTPVPASAVAAGEEASTDLEQIPLDWDPYDTSIADPWSEEDNIDVCSDDESKNTKTRQVLRRLKSDQYDNFFTDDVYMFPFCTRRLHATDFNSLVKHAEDVRTRGESMNVHSFRTKHQALGFHLHNLQKVAIKEGRMPSIKPKAPKVKGLGNKKWRRYQREEAEAMRGH